MPKRKKIYREYVQELICKIDTAYIDAGSIRDIAVGEEKDYFNKVRGLLNEASTIMGHFDDNLSIERAMMKI